MLALVKKPRTRRSPAVFENPTDEMLQCLRSGGFKVEIDDSDESINIRETKWFKEHEKNTKPGDYVSALRKAEGWTQAELAGKLGWGDRRQCISDIENNRRSISKEIAKKLAKVFDKPVQIFI